MREYFPILSFWYAQLDPKSFMFPEYQYWSISLHHWFWPIFENIRFFGIFLRKLTILKKSSELHNAGIFSNPEVLICSSRSQKLSVPKISILKNIPGSCISAASFNNYNHFSSKNTKKIEYFQKSAEIDNAGMFFSVDILGAESFWDLLEHVRSSGLENIPALSISVDFLISVGITTDTPHL